jgi:hypothetical protein
MTMREQTIQFVSEPGAGGIAATVDASEAERLLAILGGSAQIEFGLAPESDDDVEGHLFGAGAIVRLIVRRSGDDSDVEGHALTLRFPTAAEAAKFKMKILAGGLLVGTLLGPAAGLAGTAVAANNVDTGVGNTAAVTTTIQAPVFHDDKLQIVLPDDGSSGSSASVPSGENNAMGSAVAWATRTDAGR